MNEQQPSTKAGVHEKDVKMSGDTPRGNDVLRLNVGGTRIDVLRRTLTVFENSMLYVADLEFIAISGTSESPVCECLTSMLCVS